MSPGTHCYKYGPNTLSCCQVSAVAEVQVLYYVLWLPQALHVIDFIIITTENWQIAMQHYPLDVATRTVGLSLTWWLIFKLTVLYLWHPVLVITVPVDVPAQHGGGARSAQAHCWPHSSTHRAWIRKYLRVDVFISLSLVGSPWWLLLISQVKQHKITTKLGMVNIVLDFSSASTLTMKGVG